MSTGVSEPSLKAAAGGGELEFRVLTFKVTALFSLFVVLAYLSVKRRFSDSPVQVGHFHL